MITSSFPGQVKKTSSTASLIVSIACTLGLYSLTVFASSPAGSALILSGVWIVSIRSAKCAVFLNHTSVILICKHSHNIDDPFSLKNNALLKLPSYPQQQDYEPRLPQTAFFTDNCKPSVPVYCAKPFFFLLRSSGKAQLIQYF